MELKPWFLNCRPIRRLNWEEVEGRVIVLRPRLGESRWGRRLAAWLGLTEYRIRLDEIGSFIWHRCDGRTTAGRMAEHLRNQFGRKVEPAEQRLQHFILQMRRARMVNLETDLVASNHAGPVDHPDRSDRPDGSDRAESRDSTEGAGVR